MVSTKPYRHVAKVYIILSECLMNTRSSDTWMICCIDVYNHSVCDMCCYFTPTSMFPQFTKKTTYYQTHHEPHKKLLSILLLHNDNKEFNEVCNVKRYYPKNFLIKKVIIIFLSLLTFVFTIENKRHWLIDWLIARQCSQTMKQYHIDKRWHCYR
jgi:hypothetical protein